MVALAVRHQKTIRAWQAVGLLTGFAGALLIFAGIVLVLVGVVLTRTREPAGAADCAPVN